MTNKKKAIVVSIMGRLVKKTASRHYWLYDGAKWDYRDWETNLKIGRAHV